MNDQTHANRSQADADLEREIRNERTFSLSEAIGRLAGPGCMKGASPVARKRQAELEIGEYLNRHLFDAEGACRIVLLRQLTESDLLLTHLDQPLAVIAICTQRILESDSLLRDFVREADVEWGRMQGERPHFDREGAPPDSEDPYTVESVRAALSQLREALVRS